MSNLSVAIDLMGGDHSPSAMAKAVIGKSSEFQEISFHVVGTASVLKEWFGAPQPNVITHQVDIGSDSSAGLAQLVRLKDKSSLGYCVKLLQDGVCASLISAGNTAGLMTLGCLLLKTQQGIRRPAIISSIHYHGSQVYLSDIGANVGATADDLVNNAKMAVEESGNPEASVALLNVGTEDSKGTDAIKDAASKLKGSPINFIGYVEGDNMLSGKADIVVCDAFVGNCLTKFLERTLHDFSQFIPKDKMPRFAKYARLAGINGKMYKAHGKSTAEDLSEVIADISTQLLHVFSNV